MENLYNWMDNLWLKVENIVSKGELLVLSNFFFCHYVFKKPSAAEASESSTDRKEKKCWAEQKTLTGRPRRRRRQGHDNNSRFFKSRAKNGLL